MLKITIVVGNPKPKSRTLKVAEAIAENLVAGKNVDLQVIDIVEYADELFQWPSDRMSALTARVAASDLAFFASPTYKASYTGVLKAFLDRYPAGGLQKVVAVCLMTGADATHTLAPTVSLLPLLLELGATVPINGLYFNTTQFDRLDQYAAASADKLREAMARLSSLDHELKPAPVPALAME